MKRMKEPQTFMLFMVNNTFTLGGGAGFGIEKSWGRHCEESTRETCSFQRQRPGSLTSLLQFTRNDKKTIRCCKQDVYGYAWRVPCNVEIVVVHVK